MAGNKYLKVNVSEGMFSNEFAVEIKVEGHVMGTAYVDKKLIKEEGPEKYIKLSSTVNAGPHYKAALLPTEIIENGTRWVRVPKAEISER